ncbi:MAG: hypothetical protein EXR72_27305 [Myxococcales bacterium]|nr:hypothetical protein [Myxococcales bacterium]
MPKLADHLTAPEKRPVVIKELAVLVDQEVASKGGLSGFGIKAAYAMVKAIKPSFVPDVISGMFDECVAKLEPIYAEYATGSVKQHFAGRAPAVAEALLAVTDGRAQRTTHGTAKKAYLKLRPTAKRNVEEAVPRLAELIERHTRPAAA